MSFILLIDKIKNKIIRSWRKRVFKELINCPHNQFCLVGKVHLINKNIKLGKNVTIYPDVMFFGDGLIEIGDNVDVGNNTIIYASKSGGGITIGKNTLIAAHTYIIDCDHGMQMGIPIRQQSNNVEPIEIGEDVWISAGAKI